ncbi:MAG: hypothetical protein JST84_16185 [Acidobacteria bacterium]|nr:hypothetical protein [Acidobacteriota bacterium]
MQKPKLLSSLILISLLAIIGLAQAKTDKPKVKKLEPRVVPTLRLESGVILDKADEYYRANPQTVCAGDKLGFTARVSGIADAEVLPVKWTISGGRGASDINGHYVLDTTGLTPGTYIVTAEASVPYKECEGNCTAYDSKTFVIVTCPACFTSPTVSLTSSMPVINPGEALNICASTVTGGVNYGKLVPTWATTAGKISGDASCAKLDTTGIAYGSTVTVNLKLTTDLPNCEASGQITFKVAEQLVEAVSEFSPCNTFKTNSARVDNVCKANLVEIVRQLESDPSAQLIIDSYSRPGEKSNMSLERGKNVRDRLADGSIGVKVDANRLIVRPSGQSDDGSQVRLFLMPAGSKLPPGAAAADVGGVSREAQRAPVKRR